MLLLKKNKCAVLLAAYNGESFIKTQINSILSQENVNLDVFISLDLSTDSSLNVCQYYSANFKNVFLLDYGTRYGSASANFFHLIETVSLEEYDFVALADQDDYWFPWKLSKAIDELNRHDCEGYSANAIAYWESEKALSIVKSQPQMKFDYFFESAGHGCTYVLRSFPLMKFRDLLKEKKEIASSISQHDWLIYAFFREKGFKWFIDSDFSMLYRQHLSNDFGVNSGFKSIVNRSKMVFSGWYKKQVEKNIEFLDADFKMLDSRVKLILNIRQLRRRNRDRFALFIFLVFFLM